MPINSITYATQLQKKLDQAVVAGLTSGFMDANAGDVIYNGGRTIKIPTLALTGLKDYDRDKGYTQGAVTLTYEEMEMTMDRGTKFRLDAMDVNESNFLANASSVSSEFQSTQVIPEVDAYRYSRIAALADANKHAYTLSADTVYDALLDDLGKVQDKVGGNVPVVICISGKAMTALTKMKGFDKIVGVADFKRGEISTKVRTVNECPLMPVPSSRMKTSYVFNDGETEGQKNGGFQEGTDAKQINWIIMPQKAPIAVCKQDKIKIITPEVNQTADAWDITYRKYHDLWIKKSQLGSIVPNVEN